MVNFINKTPKLQLILMDWDQDKDPQVLSCITNLVASFNGGKEATRKLVPALSRLMYGPVHFQGPARNEQFKCQNEG